MTHKLIPELRLVLVVALFAANIVWGEDAKWTPPPVMQQRFDLKKRIESASGLIPKDEAIETLRSLAVECDLTLGPDDPVTWECRNVLARAFGSQGKNSEAEGQQRIILRVQENVLGFNHSETLSTRESIADKLTSQQKYAEAAAEYSGVLKARQEALEYSKLVICNVRQALGYSLFHQGKYEASKAEYRAVLTQAKQEAKQELDLGRSSTRTGSYRYYVMDSERGIANCLRAERKFKEAEVVLRMLLKEREKENDMGYLLTAATIHELIECLMAQGKRSEVLQLAQHAYEIVKTNEKGDGHLTLYYKKLWDDLKAAKK